MDKKRLAYWDIAKGVAIITCVIGHSPNIPIYLRNIIFSFHMPLFFIANAYFIKNYDVANTTRKASRSLLLPYCITCLIASYLAAERNNDLATNVYIFRDRIVDMFVGMSKISTRFTSFQSVWLVWFVICLFFTRVIYVLIMNVCSRIHKSLALVAVMGLAYIGYWISVNYAFLPWSLDVALYSLPLMYVGDNSRRIIEKHRDNKRFVPFYGGATILATVLWILLVRKGFVIEMATRSYPGIWICLITAISGSLVIAACSRVLEKISFVAPFLIWCGRNSMIILIIHCLEMRFFNWDEYVYCHLPFLVEGSFYRTWIVKLTFILVCSFVISKILCFVKSDRLEQVV